MQSKFAPRVGADSSVSISVIGLLETHLNWQIIQSTTRYLGHLSDLDMPFHLPDSVVAMEDNHRNSRENKRSCYEQMDRTGHPLRLAGNSKVETYSTCDIRTCKLDTCNKTPLVQHLH